MFSEKFEHDSSLPEPVGLSKSTSTANYRYHLFTNHLDEWVSRCDKKDINITAKTALPFLNKYRLKHGQQPIQIQSIHCIPYSPEALVDAISEFIIATSQVITFSALCMLCINLHNSLLVL
jgi:hypothetical protein